MGRGSGENTVRLQPDYKPAIAGNYSYRCNLLHNLVKMVHGRFEIWNLIYKFNVN